MPFYYLSFFMVFCLLSINKAKCANVCKLSRRYLFKVHLHSPFYYMLNSFFFQSEFYFEREILQKATCERKRLASSDRFWGSPIPYQTNSACLTIGNSETCTMCKFQWQEGWQWMIQVFITKCIQITLAF